MFIDNQGKLHNFYFSYFNKETNELMSAADISFLTQINTIINYNDSCVFLDNNGHVFYCGNIGSGPDDFFDGVLYPLMHTQIPKMISGEKAIKCIGSDGFYRVLMSDYDGYLYILGWNLEISHYLQELQKIENIINVENIFTGESSCIVTTADSKIYGYGNLEIFGDEPNHNFIEIDLDFHPIDISISFTGILFLDISGDVYSCGISFLSSSGSFNKMIAPTKIPTFSFIKQIAANEFAFLMLDNDGDVFILGTNKDIDGPTKILNLPNILQISSDLGTNFYMLDEKGSVWLANSHRWNQCVSKVENIPKIAGINKVISMSPPIKSASKI